MWCHAIGIYIFISVLAVHGLEYHVTHRLLCALCQVYYYYYHDYCKFATVQVCLHFYYSNAYQFYDAP